MEVQKSKKDLAGILLSPHDGTGGESRNSIDRLHVSLLKKRNYRISSANDGRNFDLYSDLWCLFYVESYVGFRVVVVFQIYSGPF
jgi:hypothetical protein